MIRAVAYSGTTLKDIELNAVSPLRQHVWIHAENPSPLELKQLSQILNIPQHQLHYALDQKESPRIAYTNDYLTIIFSAIIHNQNEKFTCNPFGLYLGKRFLLTITKKPIDALAHAETNSEQFKDLMKQGVEHVMKKILSTITNEFTTIVDKLEMDVEHTEDMLVEEHPLETVKVISHLKKTFLYLRRGLNGNKQIVSTLARENIVKNSHEFEEVYIELNQLLDEINIYNDRLSTALDIYFTITSNKINETMKSYTVMASILLVPMVITGFYGMNIVLPLQHSPYSFWIFLLLVIGSVLLTITFFKKQRWL